MAAAAEAEANHATRVIYTAEALLNEVLTKFIKDLELVGGDLTKFPGYNSAIGQTLKDNLPDSVRKQIEKRVKLKAGDALRKQMLVKLDKVTKILKDVQLGVEIRGLLRESTTNPGNIMITTSKIIERMNKFNKGPGLNEWVAFYQKSMKLAGETINKVFVDAGKKNLLGIMLYGEPIGFGGAPYSEMWAKYLLADPTYVDDRPSNSDVLIKDYDSFSH